MAFWFTSKDFVTRVAVLRVFSLAVLMGGYFFSPCHCGPIKREVSNNDPWWCQPCKEEHKTRHSRGINELVKDSFKIVITKYENDVAKYVGQVHTKLQIGNVAKQQFKKYNWLPRRKFFRKLQENDEKILPELHYQVQIYAVTIQRLLNMEIRSPDDSFDMAYRKKTLDIVKGNIDQLRCDIEQEIGEKQLGPPEKVPSNFVDKKIPSAVDHLQDGLIKDYSILKHYYNFLKKCYNKMFKPKKQAKKGNQKKKSRTKKTDLNQKSA